MEWVMMILMDLNMEVSMIFMMKAKKLMKRPMKMNIMMMRMRMKVKTKMEMKMELIVALKKRKRQKGAKIKSNLICSKI
jgi:hypothetical protein